MKCYNVKICACLKEILKNGLCDQKMSLVSLNFYKHITNALTDYKTLAKIL